MSAARAAVAQGVQSQRAWGQVQGWRAKAGVVNVGVWGGGEGAEGEGGAVVGEDGCVCAARGRERQVVQRRRWRFGSVVVVEGGLVMQFCVGEGDALV